MAHQIDTAEAGITPSEGDATRPDEVAADLPLIPRVGWWRIASWSAILLGISAVAGVVAGTLQVLKEGPMDSSGLSPGYYLLMMVLTVLPSLGLVASWIRRQGLEIADLWGVPLDSQSRVLAVLAGATLFMAQQVLVGHFLEKPPLDLDLDRVRWGFLVADLLLRGAAGPVVEEFFFRGLLMAALTGRGLGNKAVVVLTSLIFAALHIDSYSAPLHFGCLVIFGAVLAVVRIRSRGLEACVLLHGAHNIGAVLLLAAL